MDCGVQELPSSTYMILLQDLDLRIPHHHFDREIAWVDVFAIGIINHLFPITFWFGTLILVVALGTCIYGDWRF